MPYCVRIAILAMHDISFQKTKEEIVIARWHIFMLKINNVRFWLYGCCQTQHLSYNLTWPVILSTVLTILHNSVDLKWILDEHSLAYIIFLLSDSQIVKNKYTKAAFKFSQNHLSWVCNKLTTQRTNKHNWEGIFILNFTPAALKLLFFLANLIFSVHCTVIYSVSIM